MGIYVKVNFIIETAYISKVAKDNGLADVQRGRHVQVPGEEGDRLPKFFFMIRRLTKAQDQPQLGNGRPRPTTLPLPLTPP